MVVLHPAPVPAQTPWLYAVEYMFGVSVVPPTAVTDAETEGQ
jgi:hypothetical protein